MKTISKILSWAITFHFLGCQNTQNESLVAKTEPIDASIERGEYLVTIMDCNTCHTPNIMTDRGPRPDKSRLLSGYPADRTQPKFNKEFAEEGVLFYHPDLTASGGPWGISYAANLTPDETGIGTWSLDQFKRAMQQGKFKGLEGSRTLLPPMPWEAYKRLSEMDVEAIFNYLKSLDPVDNVVPSPVAPEQ